MSENLLTVGMATHQDFDGCYFTISSLRAHHPAVDIIVVDNHPAGCQRTKAVCEANGGKYYHKPNLHGTSAPRDEVFRLAQTPWVMCCDSHVLFETGAVEALIRYAEDHPDSRDIIQGPLVYDNGGLSTHWRPTTPPGLWGVWDVDYRAVRDTDLDQHLVKTNPQHQDEAFEIPMQGLGIWAMRKAAWPTFNPLFTGFGGEEGYLHELVRRRGGRALCLPELRWRHRFRDGRFEPVPYPLRLEDHVWNLLVGHRELGIDATDAIRKDFGSRLPAGSFEAMVKGAERCQPWNQPGVRPAPLKMLGIWYTNNSAPPKVMLQSLQTIKRAQELTREDVKVVTCPWEHVQGNPFPETLATYRSGPAHLNIARQQRQCLMPGTVNGYVYDEAWEPAVVCFLEHDVLYPPDYFDRVAKTFRQNPDATVVSNLDYIGLNASGWLRVRDRHEPLHQLSVRYDEALANLDRAEAEAEAAGMCELEPEPHHRYQRAAMVRETESGLLGADFDSTITAGWVPPSDDYVVITGRFPHEEDVVRKVVGDGHRIFTRTPEATTDELIGRFKARTIKELGVVEFWDDNPIHVAVIRQECPGVVVHHVRGSPGQIVAVPLGPTRRTWARIPPQDRMPAVHINH